MKLDRRLTRLLGASWLTVGALSITGIAASSLLQASAAGAAGCTAAGTTGLTAAIVATNAQTIDQTTVGSATVNATGCDLGIYVGPTVAGVTIGGSSASEGLTISGANDTGIFAEQQPAGVIIENNTVQNNGVNPNPKIGSFGGIVLAGVTDGSVENNTIINNGGGGVFVNDNGPVNLGPRCRNCRGHSVWRRHGQQQHDLGQLRIMWNRLLHPQHGRRHHGWHRLCQHHHGSHRRIQGHWS